MIHAIKSSTPNSNEQVRRLRQDPYPLADTYLIRNSPDLRNFLKHLPSSTSRIERPICVSKSSTSIAADIVSSKRQIAPTLKLVDARAQVKKSSLTRKNVTGVEDSQSLRDFNGSDPQLTNVVQIFLTALLTLAHDTQYRHLITASTTIIITTRVMIHYEHKRRSIASMRGAGIAIPLEILS